MCNGTSSRQSLGGTIAILKSPRLNESTPDMSLLLADDHQTGVTTATLSGINALAEDRQVVIHRDGDLRSPLPCESTILHRFAIPAQSRPGMAFALQMKLDLGVGGMGIIGRRVSLLHGQVVAAEGILGWN